MDISPPEPLNFAQHLFPANAGRAAKIAYVDDRGQPELRRARASARAASPPPCSALGMRREERVLLLMHDGNDWPVAFLGCLYAGVVPVAVNTLLTADDYAYMLAHSRAQAVLVSAALLPLLRQAMAQATHEVQHLIVVARRRAPLPAGALAFDALLAASEPLAEPARDTAATTPPSGSIRRARPASPRAPCTPTPTPGGPPSCTASAVLGLTENDVCFSAAKLFFAYGLGNALTLPARGRRDRAC